MATLDSRIKFAETYVRTKEGKPWTLEGRPWVVDQYWRPLEGWKWWPNNPTKLCDDCKLRAGELAAYSKDNFSITPEHAATGCEGLYLSPIIVTVLNLARRDGKTFNTAAYSLATIFQSKNESITFVASAESQTAQLFEENYRRPIAQSPKLLESSGIVAQTIRVPSTKSFFECVATSHGSITGRGRTRIIIDEARDIPARVAMAVIPSVFDHAGWECPNGHVRYEGLNRRNQPTVCSVCASELTPWYGRIAIMSSSGLVTGTDRDWFQELVEELEATPHPNYHLFRSDSTDLNPDKNKTIMGAVEQVFSKLESTRAYVDIEVHNLSRQKDDAFLTRAEIEACVDRTLDNVMQSERMSVAFLDTSVSQDKTSLVILADETKLDGPSNGDVKPKPWDRVLVERIDFWTPASMPRGVIDPDIILAHLDAWLPMFPNLQTLHVDTRGMPWAVALVRDVRKTRVGWGKKTHDYNGGRNERSMSWMALEQRFKSGSIRIPNHEELIKELLGVRRQKTLNKETEIRDASRKRRHADIAESLAECCRQAHLQMLKRSVTLLQTERATTAKDLLARTYRPLVRGLGSNSY